MRAKSSTIDWSTLSWHLAALRTLAAKEAETDIRVRMKQIVPEYFYPGLRDTSEDVSLLQVSAVPGD
jgi:hypothetical protein